MSAKRKSLLAAAALCGALAPTASCWAQGGAYGSKAVVEHNDLRWFEPTELDLDGQMPRRDAGFFGSFEKMYTGSINPRVEVGHEGLTVDSERIYRAPSLDLAYAALTQTEGFGFIDTLQENIQYTGLSFVIADTMGTDSLSDDTVTPFDTSGFLDVAALETAVAAFNNDPTNIANNLSIRVGGEPKPYQIRNGIRDALPDAGFSWGERYEFGYSDGERGWMVTVVDGPKQESGGTYGAGPGANYFSQSGQDFYGADEFFLGDLEDDGLDGVGDADGEGDATDIFAFGFGSVPVNFNLPSPDFLDGYRDYFDNSVGASGGTTAGPLMYVGNYGSAFTDITVIDITGNPSQGRIDVATSLQALGNYTLEASDPPTTDPNETSLNNQLTIILNDLNRVSSVIGNLEEEDQETLEPFYAAALGSVNALQTAQDTLASGNGGMVPPNQLNAEIAAANSALTNLNTALAGIGLVVQSDGEDFEVNTAARVADDLDGNGQAGVYRVLADIDGDGTIEADEIIGLINNFGDLHTFNVFFDDVTVRNQTKIDSVEVLRTHRISTRHKLQQGRWDDVQFNWGVSFTNVQDDFFFQGEGSILGRTWVDTDVENQVVGPTLGLKWIRRDGPWDFVLEGRGTLGYNIVDVDQQGIFGMELIPGALNRPATARTTTSVDGARYDEFSPLGELRAQLRYRLAKSVTLSAGYTAKYVANIHRGAMATAWNAPDFGIDDSTSDIFSNGLTFGVELRH